MTTIAEQLSSYAANLRYDDLPPEVVHQAKRMIIDTIGCALGGYDSEPARVAMDVAATVTSATPATILVSNRATSPDLAAFANGVMLRYLDFNDGYTSRESGHPSDAIAATLAATEVSRGGGKRFITATVLAYEVFCRICDAVDLKPNGFDHVTVGCVAGILGAARGLGLSEAHTAQAINLGVAANLALYQTRIGEVSAWKGCAFANASRNAVFAVMLAGRGLSGPAPVFEGPGGYFTAVSRGPFHLEAFGGPERPFKIMECSIKRYPLGQYSQTVAEAALQVRAQLPNPQDIAEVRVSTLQTAVNIMAGDPQKWAPANRETADHSMPYTAAVALLYGEVDRRHFDPPFLNDPELMALVGKVKVGVSEEANRRAPDAMLCDLEVVTNAGQRYRSQVAYHKGHYKNPLSDTEVEAKFRSLAEGVIRQDRVEALLRRLWRLEEVKNVAEIIGRARI